MEGPTHTERLEYLRTELRAEQISYEELAELQSLSKYIASDDVELLEAAGIPEKLYVNHFMHCGIQWTDEWSCMCDDECPVCHAEIEPYKSEDQDGSVAYHVTEAWTPEGGWPEGCTSRED